MSKGNCCTNKAMYDKLHNISAHIMKGRIPRDDTLLEKLVSFIKALVVDDCSLDIFCRNTDLFELVNKHIITCSDTHKNSYVFTCQVLIHCVHTASNDGSKRKYSDFLKELLELSKDDCLWSEPSVRNIVMQGGVALLESDEAHILWIKNTGLSRSALRCLYNDSIFVTKSASELIARTISALLSFKHRSVSLNSNSDSLLSEYIFLSSKLLEALPPNSVVKTSAKELCIRLPVALDILEQLVLSDMGKVWFHQQGVHCKLQEILLTFSDIEPNTMSMTASILAKDIGREVTPTDIKALLQQLLDSGKYWILINMASCFIKLLPSLTNFVIQDILKPIILTLSGSHHDLGVDMDKVKGRTEVTKLLLQCLSTFQTIDVCASELEILVQLLRLTMESQSHQMLNNKKLQQATFKTLAKHLSRVCRSEQASVSMLHQMLAISLHVLQPCDVPCSLINEVYKCVAVVLPWLLSQKTSTSPIESGEAQSPAVAIMLMSTPDLVSLLAEKLKLKLCDRQWEIRDATLELIKDVLVEKTVCDVKTSQWIKSHGFIEEIWACVADGESYVRATALSTLSYLFQWPQLWKHLLVKINMSTFAEKMEEIIRTDMEAFARRAAMSLICQYWRCSRRESSNYSSTTDIYWVYPLFKQGLLDLDWQVKLESLRFYDETMDNSKKMVENGGSECPSKRQKVCPKMFSIQELSCLTDWGFQNVVSLALEDQDNSVQCRACEIVLQFHSRCPPVDDSMPGSVEKLVSSVCKLDVERLLNESKRSTDMYEDPESLLDDLWTAVAQTPSEEVCEVHNLTDDEDYFVDCY